MSRRYRFAEWVLAHTLWLLLWVDAFLWVSCVSVYGALVRAA